MTKQERSRGATPFNSTHLSSGPDIPDPSAGNRTAGFPVAEGAAAILLVLGLWTPGVSVLAALVELLGLSLHMADVCTAIMVGTLAITLAMIGPGAWSLDARLFGRKHLEIPNR